MEVENCGKKSQAQLQAFSHPQQPCSSRYVGTCRGVNRSWHPSGYRRSSSQCPGFHTQPGRPPQGGRETGGLTSLETALWWARTPYLQQVSPAVLRRNSLKHPARVLVHSAVPADTGLLSITQFMISLLKITLILTSCSNSLRYKINDTKPPLIPVRAANVNSKMLKQFLIAAAWKFCIFRHHKNWCEWLLKKPVRNNS